MRLTMLPGKLNPQVFTKNVNPNAVRFSVLASLMGLTAVALILSSLTSCKSTTRAKLGTTEQSDGANSPQEVAGVQNAMTDKPTNPTSNNANSGLSLSAPDVVMPLSPEDPALDMESLGEPKSAGGPVVGLEVWQDNRPVTSIVTGKHVLFRLSGDTRDVNARGGCAENPGIVQASWTIGSKVSADIQRYAGQDCRPLEYSGMFTKEGPITVRLDVMSMDGEVASSEKTFEVKNSVN